MSISAIRRVAILGAKKTPFRALSGGPEIPTEAALSYCAKDAVAKVPNLIHVNGKKPCRFTAFYLELPHLIYDFPNMYYPRELF